jgi:NADH-quinone oxidoreductase subunit L
VEEFFRESVKMNPHILEDMEHMPHLLGWLPFVMMAIGAVISYIFYIQRRYLPEELAAQQPLLYQFLLNKWYFDELYDAVVVNGGLRLARALWQTGDATVIDGVPNGLATLATDSSRQVVKVQNGSLAVYAFTMLIGVVVLIGVFMLFR